MGGVVKKGGRSYQSRIVQYAEEVKRGSQVAIEGKVPELNAGLSESGENQLASPLVDMLP